MDSNEADSIPTFRAFAEFWATILTIAALFGFIIARSYYNLFFGALGVDPSSVGFDYATTLVSSIGLLAYVVAAGVAFPVLVVSGVCTVRFLVNASPSDRSGRLFRSGIRHLRSQLPHAFRTWIPVGVVLSAVFLGLILWAKADRYSKAVESGKPVKLGSLALTSFGIRATPVDLGLAPGVESNKQMDEIMAKASTRPGLLYLGQSDGQVVLYDPTTQRAIYLPSSLVVLRLANCENPPVLEDVCEGALS